MSIPPTMRAVQCLLEPPFLMLGDLTKGHAGGQRFRRRIEKSAPAMRSHTDVIVRKSETCPSCSSSSADHLEAQARHLDGAALRGRRCGSAPLIHAVVIETSGDIRPTPERSAGPNRFCAHDPTLIRLIFSWQRHGKIISSHSRLLIRSGRTCRRSLERKRANPVVVEQIGAITMKAILAGAVLGVLVLGSAGSVDAKGCLKGAIAGGAVGHYAGHHGVAGAVVGCAVGHHQAKKHERERERSPQ
jgi:hypothetical protein